MRCCWCPFVSLKSKAKEDEAHWSPGSFSRRPPVSALSVSSFKGAREKMLGSKALAAKASPKPHACCDGDRDNLGGGGNLPGSCSGNLAADPVFFCDPTNVLGSQSVYSVKSLGFFYLSPPHPSPCSRQVEKPALGRVRCGAGTGSRATPRIALHRGVWAPAAAPRRFCQENFE